METSLYLASKIIPMQSILDIVENFGPLEKLAWVFFCLTLFWIVESVAPLFRMRYNRLRHLGINMVFFSFMMVINLIFGFFFVMAYPLVETYHFGLLNWIVLPWWVEIIIAIMAFDFISQYLAHYLLHKVKWMWKLHLVHHADTKVDATTGTRQHPGEFVLRETLALITLVLFGIPIGVYLFYRLITIFFTYWTHANIGLPRWLDNVLSYVFVTPLMHKFHHHFERPWTDSNYGNVLSIWDRLFGTFSTGNPQKIKYGVDTVDNSRDEDLGYQLGFPFNKDIKTDY